MKKLLKYTIFAAIFLLSNSCDDDFLNEEKDSNGLRSIIIISPEWGDSYTEIYCEGIINARYTISNVPEWLEISSLSGSFYNSFTTLHLKANYNPNFSEIGIYYSFLTISIVNKGDWMIPIAYITEGNPKIETENKVSFVYNSQNDNELKVKNDGEGILVWYVSEHPEWLSFTTHDNTDFSSDVGITPPYNQSSIFFDIDLDSPLPVDLSGKIVIESNDKNNPILEVEFIMDMGNPSISIGESLILNFGRMETSLGIYFRNQGDGILVWQIEDCPEWLAVSKNNGILMNDHYSYSVLTLICDRKLLQYGLNSATIYLKTNDKNKLSIPIHITAISSSANPNNIKPIEGHVTASYMDKQSDILYFTTIFPSRFVAYDTKNKKIDRELTLQYAPNCFSFSITTVR